MIVKLYEKIFEKYGTYEISKGAKKNRKNQVKSMETTMCSLICLSRSPINKRAVTEKA